MFVKRQRKQMHKDKGEMVAMCCGDLGDLGVIEASVAVNVDLTPHLLQPLRLSSPWPQRSHHPRMREKSQVDIPDLLALQSWSFERHAAIQAGKSAEY